MKAFIIKFLMRFLGIKCAVAGIIKKENKILLTKRSEKIVEGGKWCLPGGGIKKWENAEEAMRREMKEETGIIFKNPTFVGFGQDQQFHVKAQKETSRLIMFFHVKTNQEPKLDPEEAEEHKWVTLDYLKKLKKKEGALTDLFNRNPNFSL